LKLNKEKFYFNTIGVAPFTGAWIETFKITRHTLKHQVAPFTGAWIETLAP